jgi:Complex I intermediate-associated protein 30 (CIA30)/NAD(P)H-binding
MAKWDASRFLNTVSYFGAIPIFSDVQRWLTGALNTQATIDGRRSVGIILVVGATSEIGQMVVQQLLKSGYQVRAAIADLNLTPFSVPANVKFVRMDFDAIDSSTVDRLMHGIRSIIVCPDPQNSLSPAGLDNLITAAQTALPKTNTCQLFDFTQPITELQSTWGAVDDVVMGGVSESNIRLERNTQSSTDLQSTWGAVDDVVMGGVSESGIRLETNYAVFSGNVSTENSGGFASVRTRNFDPSLNLSNYQGIELRVKGDGQRYKLFVRTEDKWDGIGYAHSFDTIANEWLTIQVPFRDLVPIFRAKTVNEAAPIDTTQICSFQLMLSKFEYDRALNPRFTPGLFSLQVASISAYEGKTMPQLVVIDSVPVPADLVFKFQAARLPYAMVQWGSLDPQMVSEIAVRSIAQPEAVGQVLGH